MGKPDWMPPRAESDTSSDDGYDSESLKSKSEPARDGPVTWMSLPRKDQLLILFLSRVVDFLQIASLQAYVKTQGQSKAGSAQKQVDEHNHNVVMLLQSKLASTSMNFKDVLEIRTQVRSSLSWIIVMSCRAEHEGI